MHKLHLFNPENDIALASGSCRFTAPKAALALRNSGVALPLWYSKSGDRILAHGINGAWLESKRKLFGIDVDVFDHGATDGLTAAPWGWSLPVRREFINEGFDERQLPSDELINRYRELSHRRTASALQKRLAPLLDFEIAPPAREFSDINVLSDYLTDNPDCMIKSPWSSSGRGLTDTRRLRRDEIIRRCEGIIRKQGSVLVEQAYDRVADFAMLFECSDGSCSFNGLSLFMTDDSGNYCGNMLATDNELLQRLDRYYPAGRLSVVARSLRKIIEENIACDYSGPLGVDMLIARMPDGSHLLDATVEMNLRMTMGFVAHSLSSRYLSGGSVGRFYIGRERFTPDFDKAVIEDRRIISGRMMLTPPGGQFSFVMEADSL